MTELHIGDGLMLPLDAITETFGFLAVKRAGKSNAAVVFAEEMYDNGLPWVAVDPKGDWWGVRSSGDGKLPGLSVLVFGGLHGDVPLEPTAGQLVADLIVDQRLTCVLDVSEMTKADQRRFLRDFADRLYRRNTEPLHVFCEEADEYIPQMVRGESAKVVAAFEQLVKRGGFKGIGVSLITQRSASLNKDVLTQVGNLFVLRTTSPQDQKAILDWIKFHADSAETIAELPGLEAGEAFLYSPQWLRTLVKFRFRQRRTFDSGATPKVGVERTAPKRLAGVDLDAITVLMGETIERAKADDPKALKARIAQLERQAAQPPEPQIIRVEVPVLAEDLVIRLEGVLGDLKKHGQQAVDVSQDMLDQLFKARSAITGQQATSMQANVAPGEVRIPGRPPQKVRETVRPPSVPAPATGLLPISQRKILTVLAQHGTRTTTQVALLTGYSHKSGGYRNSLSSLRTAGHIEGRGDITITGAGLNALGAYEPLPTGRALVDWWAGQLGRAERSILEVLVERWPAAVTTDQIAEQTGYSPTSGGFRNALSRLRSLELAAGRGELRAADELGQP